MSYTLLKLVAILTMIIDHIGARLIDNIELATFLRYIGRIAFPIFAFQLVEGFKHTSNINKYKKRLLIFTLVSEIPFNYLVAGYWTYPLWQNIGLTLLLGLLSIEQLEKVKESFNSNKLKALLHLGLSILFMGIAEPLYTDYGSLGVITIILFYIFYDNKLLTFISMLILHGFIFEGLKFRITDNFEISVQILALFSLLFIWLYNGKRGYTLVEFIENKILDKAGIKNNINRIETIKDSNGNEVVVETLTEDTIVNEDITSLEKLAAREITKVTINAWRETKLRRQLNLICKYSSYIIYPLHMIIIHWIDMI